ncbi:LysR substrate-binding domain-containing protein [Ruegeria sp. 2012CJ41-6]|uniref:LysR substrate-binding domain-containing protein n=1 Tax=Ruegeria spongiae TaxID=2942209 RepID=A0ABT0Q1G0_9RHOB|nr:LysR substrate-binding domain-containing protein [Ruegeria spongiae]MCL6283718.1 LysR substrate-binding domain-containing protein [Ruegeria spongiae]
MKISIRQLSYAVAAAREGSISGAADVLNISTSSILTAIDKFEQEFGIQLFVRQRAKGLTTTAVGERAIARTIRLLDEAEAFEQDLSGGSAELSGHLSVGAFTSISPSIAPRVIRELQAEHPGLIVHLHEGDLVEIQESLKNGTVDVLLTYDAGLDEEFETEFLINAPPHVVLSECDPLAELDKISVKDLSGRTLLLLNLPQSRKYILSMFEQHHIQPGRIQRVESFEMVRSAAAAGLGAAILNVRPPSNTTYSGYKVVCRPLAEGQPGPNIVLATRPGGRISRRAAAFSQSCRQFFQEDDAKLFVVTKRE